MADTLNLDGAGLSVVRASQELHRSLHGDFSAYQVLPIASASKWLAVATIMTLVDDGTLDLDLPVSRYVKEFERDTHRRLTLRQCLSCISGLPARMGDRMQGWDMSRFAAEAGRESVRNYPGTEFIYGGQAETTTDEFYTADGPGNPNDHQFWDIVRKFDADIAPMVTRFLS